VLPGRYRTMVTLMAWMGLRPGEAYGLQVQDFDPEAGTLKVQRAVSRGKVGPTKTGETRTLPLGGLADIVAGHIDAYGIRTPEAHLFTNDQGRIIHENTFRPIFTAAAKRAGIPNNVSPNSLRHHAAAFLIHRGASVLQVSKMLGHAKALDHAGCLRLPVLRFHGAGGGDASGSGSPTSLSALRSEQVR
jgi:integrase